MIDHHEITATLQPIGLALKIKTAKVTLDEGWSPYCQAEFTCVLPEGSDRTAVDLRTSELRVVGQMRQDFGATFALAVITAQIGASLAALTTFLASENLGKITRTYYTPWNGASIRGSVIRPFNLYVTERAFDDSAKELTIVAASDDVRLNRDRLNAAALYDPSTLSVREIAQVVVSRYGATLDAAAADATVAMVDATKWRPGVSAVDYLDPMLEAASLRLWCSEVGVWTITERQATTPGAVVLSPTDTMTGHVDRMTLEPEVWADAVIIKYQWNDDLGVAQESFDRAGATVPRAALSIVKRDTRYPGSGAAAGILERTQNRGRVLDVRAISAYDLTPGMAATITPPATIAQTGYLAAITWQLPDAEMNVETRGLVDTPVTAYVYGAVGKKYTDVPIGMTYATFDWSGF